MKRFKSIAEWLKTNPSQEEQNKVLVLIHRGATSQARKELFEKERYLQKLNSLRRHMEKLGMKVPEDTEKTISKVKSEIESLKKDLPTPVKKEKKSELAANPVE